MTGLDIPLPTAAPQDDPGQYVPLLLTAIEGFLFMPDVWLAADYDEARQRLEQLKEYVINLFGEDQMACPVGGTLQWHTATIPARWLLCNGQSVAKATYPKLWALWGAKYGSTSTHFNVIDLRDRSPIGAGTLAAALDVDAGAKTHTLITSEIPAHSHDHIRAGGSASTNYTNVTGASALNPVNVAWPSQNTGGGGSHNNLHPVKGVNFIVYAGRL